MIFDENVAPQLAAGKKAVVADKPKKGNKTIEETYTKKTQLEHILLRPDTYVGSVEKQTQPMWVLDAETKQLVQRNCTFVPGLYKIFDEIIVNASDNKQRDPTMNRIEVTINPDENFLRVWNNGSGIPVAIHQEHKIYVPELIFGNLLTGSNFDDAEEKTTGGRNGYGAKLANIFSTEFIVETADKSRGLKFKQVFRDNMGSRNEPEITKYNGTDYTCITFYPDLKRFKMDFMDEDIVALLSKRVYDIAATINGSGAKLSVFLNGTRIESKSFEQYIGLCTGLEAPVAFERVSERWEIGVGASDGSFQQISFVNSIATTKGGTHVNYIADQIAARLMGVIKKKNKGQEVKAHQIKNHLAVFVNALIVNPAFDSQTKEFLTTKTTAFGSTCTLTEKFLKQVEKSNIVDNVLTWSKFKQTAELKKKGGSKRSKLIGIPKLDDANFAGTPKSKDCTLILTEGDSAKALAISGLGVVGRDYYGVFPLKGKLLNVREASHAQIMKNEEIQNIAKILGLTFGKVYEDTSSLRYGHLMIMTDQDHDGSHIKGLLINFLHHFWPSLLRIDSFLKQFITPIVKCTKGKRELTFFTIPQYQNWKEENSDGKGWKIKYYKGLGTSTAAEAKDYFSNLDTHELDFAWDPRADDVIDMAFAKKRVEDRKLWLLALQPGVHIDYDVDNISYDDFVNRELILFSHADNERSIPHFMDGLKPSQRKVLFGCFKRNLRQEIKVAQLAGYISEHSAYHHGEASLTQTIIGMAQNFVGSNNINVLSPCGQFGTRLMGGKDAASPRYVFTKLENITRHIYHPHDDPLLEYLDDDGQSIEPVCYVPVIPMVLVNGADGIGTGWSTSVPTYNPREIIANLRLMIRGEQPNEMHPWFRGFKGDVVAKAGKDCTNYIVSGAFEQIDEQTLVVSELPVGRWTTDYKQMLESMMVGAAPPAPKEKEDGTAAPAAVVPIVKDFKENHTDTTVLFTITVLPDKLAEAVGEKGGIQKRFKLDTSVATSNMMMFDMQSQIRKFDSANDVLNAFYEVRVQFYSRRKLHLLDKLTNDWDKLDNKVRFITAVIAGKLVVSNRKKAELLDELRRTGFKTFVDKRGAEKSNEEGVESIDDNEDDSSVLDRGYDYLLSMKIWSLTLERAEALQAERDQKRKELEDLRAKTPEELWLDDLDALEEALDDFEGQFVTAQKQEEAARKKAMSKAKGGHGAGKGAQKPKPKKKASYGSDDDDLSEDDDGDDSDFSADEPVKPKKRPIAASKPVAPKPIVSSKPASVPVAKPIDSQPVAKKAAAAIKPAAKSAPTNTMDSWLKKGEDVIDVDEPPALDLKARLAARMQGNNAVPAPPTKALSVLTDSKANANSKPSTKPKLIKSSTVDLSKDCDSEEEELFNDVPLKPAPAPASRQPARAAAAAKSYKIDSDDEEDVYSFPSSDDEKPKKANKKKLAAKEAADRGGAGKTVGVKRAPKGTSKFDDESGAVTKASSQEAFSPGVATPMAIKKKPRQNAKPAAAASKPVAAGKATSKAPAAKKTAPKKNIVESDDDASSNDDNDEPVVQRTPKPTRTRKPTNYANYFESSEDEEEEEDDEEASDEESEFDE